MLVCCILFFIKDEYGFPYPYVPRYRAHLPLPHGVRQALFLLKMNMWLGFIIQFDEY